MMVLIRKTAPADAAALLEYCKCVGGESDNLTFGSEGIAMTLEQEQAFLERIHDSHRQLYLVAEEAGEIVGTATFAAFSKARMAHRGEVALSVRRSHWGNHIGSRLMEEMLRFAKETAKVEILSLEVRSDNARAIALYRRFGFQRVGTFRSYLRVAGKDVDCDIMRLDMTC